MCYAVCDFIGITESVPPSVHISIKRNFSSTEKQILMKLYILVVYNLRMSRKEDNTRLNNINGEFKEIIICAG